MAAWYILNIEKGWAMITSHKAVHLMLASAVKQINGEVMMVDINKYDFTDIKMLTPLAEYLLRPKECTECWFDYLEKYAIISKNLLITGDFLTLHSNHPKYKTHVVIKRDHPVYKSIEPKPVVVQYHGYSLKSTVRRDTDEKKEIFSLCSLIMFKPFRNIRDLKGEHDTYYDHLFDFEGNMRSNVLSQTGYMLIQNNEDRWECKFASEISAKYHREEIQEAAQNIHVGVKEPNTIRGCDGFFEEIIHGDLSIYSQNYFDFMTTHHNQILKELDVIPDQDIQYPSQKNTMFYINLDEKSISEGFNCKDSVNLHRCNFLETLHHSKADEVVSLVDAAIQSLRVCVDVKRYNHIRNLYCIPENEHVTHYVSQEKGNVMFKLCSSLQEIVDVYGFTKDQKRAFVIGAIPLLKNIGDSDDDANHVQVFGVIQGLAGSGKSYIINAWKALALSWGQGYAVQCACHTGIAASNIHGKTLDSLLYTGNKKLATFIKLLIIDEVTQKLFVTFKLYFKIFLRVGLYGCW